MKKFLLLSFIVFFPTLCIGAMSEDPCYPPQYPFNVEECDAITEIRWDSENSVSEIPATGSGTVYVLDGKPGFTYEVEGTNFYLDSAGMTIKEENVAERQHQIYTINGCGTGKVTVTDFCGKKATGLIPTDIALRWDESSLIEEMDANAAHTFQIEEGSPPFTIEVGGSGSGFSIDNDGALVQSVVQGENSFTLQTINACGGVTITVSDSCNSSITADVRSSDGKWGNGETVAECPWKAPSAEWDNPLKYQYYNIKGNQRIYNHVVSRGGSASCVPHDYPYDNCRWDPNEMTCEGGYKDQRTCFSDYGEQMVLGNNSTFEGTINVVNGCIYFNGNATCGGYEDRNLCGTYYFTGSVIVQEWICDD